MEGLTLSGRKAAHPTLFTMVQEESSTYKSGCLNLVDVVVLDEQVLRGASAFAARITYQGGDGSVWGRNKILWNSHLSRMNGLGIWKQI